MERLKLADVRALSEFLRGLYAIRDLDSFVRTVVKCLPVLIASDVTYYDEVNLRKGRTAYIQYPTDAAKFPGSDEVLNTHILEHPFSVHCHRVPAGSAYRISDWLTQRQFHRLGLYNEFFRRIGIKHQMVVFLPAPREHVVAITLSRASKNFSQHERLVMSLLGPHLTQAYRNTEVATLMQQAGSAFGHGVVTLASKGRIESRDLRATALLADYFDRTPRNGDQLPEPLKRWANHQEEMLNGSNPGTRPPQPLVVKRHDGRLKVRFLYGPTQRLLLLEEDRHSPNPRELETLGLTRREAEILAWVAEGKTNGEIATIFGISQRTVAKHLELTYPKLGVENRTAAAVMVLAKRTYDPETG